MFLVDTDNGTHNLAKQVDDFGGVKVRKYCIKMTNRLQRGHGCSDKTNRPWALIAMINLQKIPGVVFAEGLAQQNFAFGAKAQGITEETVG